MLLWKKKKFPRFIKFYILSAVALAGPDQTIWGVGQMCPTPAEACIQSSILEVQE